MNKTELSAEIARRAGISRRDAEAAVVNMSEIICEKLSEGEKVQIVGFGAFEVKHRPARKARNPKTGEEVQLGERVSPIFKPGKMMKQAVCD
ncbi:MAG: HU family DNA-binding protein [Clostridia bacterium]|nr:HU family DNA-binding protein [Clostridia bacterium]